jgi:uncharacterized LabA/DUF88 family protein
MALYGHKFLKEAVSNVPEPADEVVSEAELQKFVELMAYEDISHGTSDQIKEFCESAEAQVLTERQVLNKKSLMRLSKADDQKRRIKLIVYQMAAEKNDPDWKKMMLHRNKMKEYRAKLIKKYGVRASKIATKAQKEYISRAKKNVDVKSAAEAK